MKYINLLITLLISNFVFSQGLVATYKVYLSHPSGLKINYTGKYYYQGNQVLEFLQADYLKDNPTGMFVTNEKTRATLNMPTDSVQYVTYCLLDSGIYYSYNSFYGVRRSTFSNGRLTLKPSGQEAQLHGLRCVQTFVYSSDSSSKPYAEIWYAPDIPAPCSFTDWDSLGLMVKYIPSNPGYYYEMENFEFVDNIPQTVFNRKELNPKKLKKKKGKQN